MSDIEILNKAGILIKGKITNTALILLGKEESSYLFDGFIPRITWTLYNGNGVAKAYEHFDCSIAAENMLLEIDHLGLGSVMLGIAPLQERMDAVGKVLNLSEDLHAFTLLPIGYPGEVKEQEDRYDACRVHYLN